MSLQQRTIKIPIYHGTLTIIKADDLKDLEKKYGLEYTESSDAITFSIEKNGYTKYYMAFERHTPNIIAHECLHFVGKLFIDRDIRMDLFNDEPQCYLLGWAVDKCSKFLSVE